MSLTDISSSFIELLKKDNTPPEVKIQLITSISDLVSKHYLQFHSEGKIIERKQEDEKYKKSLEEKLVRLKSELEKIKGDYDLESLYSFVTDTAEPGTGTNDCKNVDNEIKDTAKLEVIYKLREINENEQKIYLMNYPLYKKEIDYRFDITERINENSRNISEIYDQQYNLTCQNAVNKNSVTELEKNERELFRYLNELKCNEDSIINKFDKINELENSIYDTDRVLNSRFADNDQNISEIRSKIDEIYDNTDVIDNTLVENSERISRVEDTLESFVENTNLNLEELTQNINGKIQPNPNVQEMDRNETCYTSTGLPYTSLNIPTWGGSVKGVSGGVSHFYN